MSVSGSCPRHSTRSRRPQQVPQALSDCRNSKNKLFFDIRKFQPVGSWANDDDNIDADRQSGLMKAKGLPYKPLCSISGDRWPDLAGCDDSDARRLPVGSGGKKE